MSHNKTTARITGVLYAGLVPTGMLGFLVIRPALLDPASGEATLSNLVNQVGLARIGIGLELGVVLIQALLAVWFFKLFRSVNSLAAGSLAAFAMMNSVAIMVSAMALTLASNVALDASLAPAGDQAASVLLLYGLSSAAWATGSLFFGLWLIPMGLLVIWSGWMPRALGYVLVVGGLGYVGSSFAAALVPNMSELASTMLSLPATVGEFWIMAYLLIFGVRKGAEQNT